jgi:hypothetical protein
MCNDVFVVKSVKNTAYGAVHPSYFVNMSTSCICSLPVIFQESTAASETSDLASAFVYAVFVKCYAVHIWTKRCRAGSFADAWWKLLLKALERMCARAPRDASKLVHFFFFNSRKYPRPLVVKAACKTAKVGVTI